MKASLAAGSAACAGLALMSLEICGPRLLAPAFGSDIVVWSAVIAATMIAVRLGAASAADGASTMPRRPARPWSDWAERARAMRADLHSPSTVSCLGDDGGTLPWWCGLHVDARAD